MRSGSRFSVPCPKRAPAVASPRAPVVLHAALAGRLRLYLPGWLPGERVVLERRLGMIPGVREATATPDTGNVLMLYDPKVTDPRRLTQAAARAVGGPMIPSSSGSARPSRRARAVDADRLHLRIVPSAPSYTEL